VLRGAGSVQGPGFHDFGELAAQRFELHVDGAAVGLDLCFTGTTHKAKPAPLPFKVRPRPHKPRALVG